MAYTNYNWQNQTYPSTAPTYNYYPTVSNTVNIGITWVQGESGARAYSVAPGNTILLMDSEDSVFYIKSTDSSGIPQPLRICDYTERVTAPATEETPNANYVSREEFDELKKLIDDLTK